MNLMTTILDTQNDKRVKGCQNGRLRWVGWVFGALDQFGGEKVGVDGIMGVTKLIKINRF